MKLENQPRLIATTFPDRHLMVNESSFHVDSPHRRASLVLALPRHKTTPKYIAELNVAFSLIYSNEPSQTNNSYEIPWGCIEDTPVGEAQYVGSKYVFNDAQYFQSGRLDVTTQRYRTLALFHLIVENDGRADEITHDSICEKEKELRAKIDMKTFVFHDHRHVLAGPSFTELMPANLTLAGQLSRLVGYSVTDERTDPPTLSLDNILAVIKLPNIILKNLQDRFVDLSQKTKTLEAWQAFLEDPKLKKQFGTEIEKFEQDSKKLMDKITRHTPSMMKTITALQGANLSDLEASLTNLVTTLEALEASFKKVKAHYSFIIDDILALIAKNLPEKLKNHPELKEKPIAKFMMGEIPIEDVLDVETSTEGQ